MSDLDLTDRTQLSSSVMDILTDWKLTADEQLALLGLPEGTRPRELTRLRNGAPLPNDDTVIERARHLMGIQRSLHLVFPRNHKMSAFWLKNRNRTLKGRPIAIMLNDGVDGMERVWRSLDCTKNW